MGIFWGLVGQRYLWEFVVCGLFWALVQKLAQWQMVLLLLLILHWSRLGHGCLLEVCGLVWPFVSMHR